MLVACCKGEGGGHRSRGSSWRWPVQSPACAEWKRPAVWPVPWVKPLNSLNGSVRAATPPSLLSAASDGACALSGMAAVSLCQRCIDTASGIKGQGDLYLWNHPEDGFHKKGKKTHARNITICRDRCRLCLINLDTFEKSVFISKCFQTFSRSCFYKLKCWKMLKT